MVQPECSAKQRRSWLSVRTWAWNRARVRIRVGASSAKLVAIVDGVSGWASLDNNDDDDDGDFAGEEVGEAYLETIPPNSDAFSDSRAVVVGVLIAIRGCSNPLPFGGDSGTIGDDGVADNAVVRY